MKGVTLFPIQADGSVGGFTGAMPELAVSIIEYTSEMYAKTGFMPPWIGYLASRDSTIVGTCGFKGPPEENAVEIAYFTFPGNEGDGVATAMATVLVELALLALLKPPISCSLPKRWSRETHLTEFSRRSVSLHNPLWNTPKTEPFWSGTVAPNHSGSGVSEVRA